MTRLASPAAGVVLVAALAIASNVATSGPVPSWFTHPVWLPWVTVAVLVAAAAGLEVAGSRSVAHEEPGSGGPASQQTAGGPITIQNGTLIEAPGSVIQIGQPLSPVIPTTPPDPVPPVPVDPHLDAGPAVTSRWRHELHGLVATELSRLGQDSFDHPGYAGRLSGDFSIPAARVGLVIAAGRLADDDTLTTTQLRSHFLAFLGTAPVAGLTTDVAGAHSAADWISWGGNGRSSLGAVLTDPTDTEAVPAAWARLILPGPGIGRNPNYAELVLGIEPGPVADDAGLAVSLRAWQSRFVTALKICPAFRSFLSDDLGLTTANDPEPQFAIMLSNPAALVDTEGCHTVPGRQPVAWFQGHLVASPDGDPNPDRVCQALLRQLCDYTLHLDRYEPYLPAVIDLSADGGVPASPGSGAP